MLNEICLNRPVVCLNGNMKIIATLESLVQTLRGDRRQQKDGAVTSNSDVIILEIIKTNH